MIQFSKEYRLQLQSVRELKSLFQETVLAQVIGAPHKAALALNAGPIDHGTIRSFALGIAQKGENNYQLAVRCQRRELMESKEIEQIRKKAKNEVDVRYIGRVTKLATPWTQKRHRPLRIGISVGHFNITAGTLGCFVRPRQGGKELILSNNHVLAEENKAKKGDAILQPGHFDGGRKPKDVIGKLADFVKLKKVGKNFVDAAVASITASIKFDVSNIKDIGKLSGLGSEFLDEGTPVSKLGRTTEKTEGRVTAFELDGVVVGYDIGNLVFDNQVEIEGVGSSPFSQGGDSGSLIVDKDVRAVALLFAGGDFGGSNGLGLTFANPIRTVLDSLKVDLVF